MLAEPHADDNSVDLISQLQTTLDAVQSDYDSSAMKKLATLLTAVVNRQITHAQAQALINTDSMRDLIPILHDLAGQKFQVQHAIISFGDGNQIGDISIGDVAGRDIIKFNVVIQEVHTSQEQAYDVSGLRPNPYPGMRSLTYDDRSIYTGRTHEIQQAVDKLTAPGEERVLLLVTGVSGSGKSSFAQAGVIPALKDHYRQRHQTLAYAVTHPARTPLHHLHDAMRKLGIKLPDQASTEDFITALTAKDSDVVNLIIIDQFEELFAAECDSQQREKLIEVLLNLPSFKEIQTHIIITIRSDFLSVLDEYRVFEGIDKKKIDLRQSMSPMVLEEVIQYPLREKFSEKRFEPKLVARLALEASSDAALLPLLQFTLQNLFRQGHLTLAAYDEKHNSLASVLIDHANNVQDYYDYDADTPCQRRSKEDCTTIMSLMLDLVAVSFDNDTRRDVRRSLPRSALLRGSSEEQSRRLRLFYELCSARLLSVRALSSDENQTVDTSESITIIHESLITRWPRLTEAISSQRPKLQQREHFLLALAEWQTHGRNGYLIEGVKLTEAKSLDKEGDIALWSSDAQKFLRRCIEHERFNQRLRGLAITITIFFFIVTFFAILTFQAQQAAEKSAQEAQQARIQAQAIAQAGESILDLSPDQSILLVNAISSNKLVKTDLMVTRALFQVYDQSGIRYIFKDENFTPVHFAWSPDGKAIAMADESDTFIIWDVETKHVLLRVSYKLSPEQGVKITPKEITAIAWSPDKKWIATGGWDHVARIFDAANGREVATLVHAKPIESIAWSPDSQRVATGTGDFGANSGVDPEIIAIHLWNFLDNSVVNLVGHDGVVADVDWSSDGKYILSGSGDKTVRVWDVSTEREVKQWKYSDGVLSVAWSPDATRIAASSDTKVFVWNLDDKTPPLQLIGHKDTVWSVEWSPDGTRLLTGGDDTILRIWDTQSGLLLQTLVGQYSVVRGSWSPKGNNIFSTADGIGRLWKEKPEAAIREVSHSNKVTSINWGNRNGLVVSADQSGEVFIWEALSGLKLHQLSHPHPVCYVAWSPDDTEILSADEQGYVRIWNTTSWQITREWRTYAGCPIAWSPQNRMIATGGDTARIWNADTGKLLQSIDIIGGLARNGETAALLQRPRWPNRIIFAESVAWSPDGTRLAIGIDVPSILPGRSGVVQIWNLATGAMEHTFVTEGREVVAVTWSPDGRQLISVNYGVQAEVWDVASGQRKIKLMGHTSFIHLVNWSPDARMILTSSADGTARVWDATSGFELRVLPTRQELKQEFSVAAWSPDGRFFITAGQNDVVVWNADMRLITAELTRRLCQLNAFSDDDVRVEVPTWLGCTQELQAIDQQLQAYDRLYPIQP